MDLTFVNLFFFFGAGTVLDVYNIPKIWLIIIIPILKMQKLRHKDLE